MRTTSHHAGRTAALLAGLSVFLATACASGPPPVRVEPRSEHERHGPVEISALEGDTPSAWTSWLLRLLEAEESFEKDPKATLRLVHERAPLSQNRGSVFALAELAYLTAERLGDRDCYLAAAVYAYLYLLGDAPGEAPSPYDRRFGWACDLYDRSLEQAFRDPKHGSFRLEAGTRNLPTGAVQVEVDLAGFPLNSEGLVLQPADRFDVHGLQFRVRDSGLGCPLIARVQQRGEGTAGVGITDSTIAPATAFLRVKGDLEDFATGIPAVLELHLTHDATTVDVGAVHVPLESDQSASLASGIQDANLWRFDLRGLFRGTDAALQNGLLFARSFQPHRIPVVLVHGTGSNPAYWAEMLNSLLADPLLRERVQFWFFIYTTGNPIVFSAATLRESLQKVLQDHDPEGREDALRHMVIVGHSQGGLLARMTGIHVEAEEVAGSVLGAPLEDLGLDEAQTQLMRRLFDVEPLPFVDRIVFVATPHRGSFLADSWFARFFAKMIAVPGDLAGVAQQIAGSVPREKLPPGMESRVPTSLDNMNPKNPVVRFLTDTPIDARIHVHSIIPIGKAKEPAGASDGVVKYESAHIEGVDSEMLVPSGHSCQSHPRTIIELRRILHEHIRAVDGLRGSK